MSVNCSASFLSNPIVSERIWIKFLLRSSLIFFSVLVICLPRIILPGLRLNYFYVFYVLDRCFYPNPCCSRIFSPTHFANLIERYCILSYFLNIYILTVHKFFYDPGCDYTKSVWYMFSKSIHFGKMLHLLYILYIISMLLFILTSYKEIRYRRRIIETETAGDLLPYTRYIYAGGLLLIPCGLLILFSILSSSLLQIFGTLALLMLFIFVLSFVALGFNIVPSENYIDDITTQKCLDGDTENLPEQDINDHQSDERMAQIEKTLETWAASGGFKDPTVTLGTLSQQLHIMRSDLTYYFEKHIKLTFRVWLSDIRFHEVQRMLKKYPEYNNDAISMECGFSSRAHLYRIFKQKTDMTPGEWKLSLQDKESDN